MINFRIMQHIEEFAVNLSYSQPIDKLEPHWKPIKRYDCKHHYVEKHEYWISHRARRIREWEGKTLAEVLNWAKRDLLENFAHYIEQMRQRCDRAEGDADEQESQKSLGSVVL